MDQHLPPMGELMPGITYQKLGEAIAVSGKNVKRDLTTLRNWMAWLQVMPHHTVGAELGDNFPIQQNAYLDRCQSVLSEGSFNNRRSALKSIWTLYSEIFAGIATHVEDNRSFKEIM